jgi:hypothetical protein
MELRFSGRPRLDQRNACFDRLGTRTSRNAVCREKDTGGRSMIFRPGTLILGIAAALSLLVLTQCSGVRPSADGAASQQGNAERVKFGFPF